MPGPQKHWLIGPSQNGSYQNGPFHNDWANMYTCQNTLNTFAQRMFERTIVFPMRYNPENKNKNLNFYSNSFVFRIQSE